MTAIANGQNSAGFVSSSSSTFVDVLREDATSFVAGAKYLFVVTMGAGADNDSALQEYQVIHGSTVFPGSLAAIMPWDNTNNRMHDYSFMTVFEQPGGGAEDIAIQYRSPGSDTVWVLDPVLTWIRLDADLTENTDWYFNEDDDEGSPTTLTTTFAPFANLTFTPGNNNDDWLVIQTVRIDSLNNNKQQEVRLNRDDTDLTPEYSQEGEDIGEEKVHLIARAYQLSDSEHTFEVEARQDSDAGGDNTHLYSNIFALRLDAFEDHDFDYTEGTATRMPADARREVAAITPFTPQTAGDFWIYGSYVSDMDALARDMIVIQVDGSTVPSGYDDTEAYRGLALDTTDEIIKAHHCIESFAASSRDIDMDAEASGGSGGNWQHRFLVTFSMELAPSGATHDGDAAVSGSGTVGGDASLIANGIATLLGVGTSIADASAIFGADASIAGSGTVTADGKRLAGGSAAISGTGTVVATGSVVKPGAASISGAGTVGAQGNVVLDASGVISGAGTASAGGTLIADATADCSGTGTISATASSVLDASASINGVGTVAAVGELFILGGRASAGRHFLFFEEREWWNQIVVAGATQDGAATISGVGSVGAQGNVIYDTSASISGTGAAGAQASAIFDTSAAISGTGTVGAAGAVGLFGVASISSAGLVGADGSVIFDASASISGTGTIVADGKLLVGAIADINGVGTVSATGTVLVETIDGAATISSIGTVTAQGNVVFDDSAAINGVGAVTAAGSIVFDGSATCAGIGSVGANGSRIFDGGTTISGTGTIEAQGAVVFDANVTISGVGTVVADGSVLVTIIGEINLTLPVRSIMLTLQERSNELTLPKRSNVLTLPEREN